MSKLKPCPFCGGNKLVIHGPQAFWIVCRECGAEGPTPSSLWKTKKEAAKAWNRRAKDEL